VVAAGNGRQFEQGVNQRRSGKQLRCLTEIAAIKIAVDMKTTLELPDELFRLAKSRAAQRGTTLKSLITQALQKELGQNAGQPKVGVAEFLRDWDALSRKVTAKWKDPKIGAVETMREQRRRSLTPVSW